MPEQSPQQPQARYAAARILGLWGLTLALIAGCTESQTLPSAPSPVGPSVPVVTAGDAYTETVRVAALDVPPAWTMEHITDWVQDALAEEDDPTRVTAWRPRGPGGEINPWPRKTRPRIQRIPPRPTPNPRMRCWVECDCKIVGDRYICYCSTTCPA